jgi:hypothetical protein
MSNHTPGPWWIDWNVSRLDIFSSDAATLVATLRRSALSEGIDETARANARLIAAAPDLLEVLEELLSMCQRQENFTDDGDGCMFDRASAAIAKARREK